MRLVLSSMFVLALAACGGDDGDVVAIDARTPDGSSSTIDAPPSTGNNVLGTVCSMAAPCPEGNTCVTLMGVGSATMGYCSPMCTQAGTECVTGYTGPAGGRPQCALSMAAGAPPTLCAIVCAAAGDCPSGLACTPVPNQPQPVSVCAAPA
jgi:hypothetical protein